MRISDWSSDVCSSDLFEHVPPPAVGAAGEGHVVGDGVDDDGEAVLGHRVDEATEAGGPAEVLAQLPVVDRSEEHTSELQSLMRRSYAVSCWTKNNKTISRLHYRRR